MRIFTVVPAFILLAACAKPPSTPPTTSSDPTGEEKPVAEGGSDERPQLTAAACEAEGGAVVGDIGDGAIHQPDYRCPDSGEAPIGSIVAEDEDPIAIEGSVCCK
jgi:hypothetical protein